MAIWREWGTLVGAKIYNKESSFLIRLDPVKDGHGPPGKNPKPFQISTVDTGHDRQA